MQTSHSNGDSSAGSHILQNIQGNVQVSNQHDVSYRHRQLVEDKVTIIQLPTEILAQIFLYCIPEDGDRTPAQHLDPMLLTTVCRRWREIAVDMPSLWRKLRLEVGHGNWQHRAFCYDTYLKRSRGHQLSLTLECHNDDGKELRSLLQPYVNQISSLSFGLSFGASSCPVVAADFGGLEKLVMYTTGSNSALTIAHSVAYSIAQLPPSMRTLKLTDLWLDLKMLSGFNPLAWVNLTNLEIVVDALNCFPRLLRLCPNLSSLTIIGMFSSVIETSEELPHSKLQSLRISGDLLLDWTGSLGLFDIITLPNLRAIEARDVGPWPHEAFKGFLTRSQCPLESLIFGGGVVTTRQQLEEYRTTFPSLSLVTDPMRCSFYF
ncbi:uncharacterized protein F5891DRAFT_546218 [Suillus fuscotomentosus]|uniref:F-box domain-containing protein n=1 Tax=Suillus fuscotomentosus TaxID=1912939 RepID=A0AAD4E2H5_9AGAM|nr:uncharacterized protein F5891DRAFT_546218 [Suillus fuscotomentosus]KAG1897093.1 hypothetical protein F5891DRAFT_546218 [Suillus fuscotomentosus]